MAKSKAKSADRNARTAERHDRNPKTKPGVTGFVQEYNQDPGPTQDLNPDAVTEDSVLPEPQQTRAENAPKATRSSKRSTAVAPMGTADFAAATPARTPRKAAAKSRR